MISGIWFLRALILLSITCLMACSAKNVRHSNAGENWNQVELKFNSTDELYTGLILESEKHYSISIEISESIEDWFIKKSDPPMNQRGKCLLQESNKDIGLGFITEFGYCNSFYFLDYFKLHEEANWFEMLFFIEESDSKAIPVSDLSMAEKKHIYIFKPIETGELIVVLNDAMLMYWNNQGSYKITITKI